MKLGFAAIALALTSCATAPVNPTMRSPDQSLAPLGSPAPRVNLPAACTKALSAAEKARLEQLQPLVRWRWFLEREPAQKMLSEVSKDDGIAVYDIDMFYVDPSDIAKLKAKNKIVICYFPAGSMQFSKRTSFTDPVEKTGPIPCDQRNLEPFREEMAPFLRNIQKQDVCGYVRDWPDNCWFDVRSKRVREAAERLILEAKSRGCDGVEFDNIDGGLDEENWTDARCPGKAANVPASRKEMEQAQLAFNRSIAEFARKNCLFAGLKNGHLVSQKQCPHFDFVIVESVLSEATKHPNDEDAAKSVRDWSACAEKGRPIFAAEYPEDFASYRCPNIPGYSITYFPNRRFVDGGVSCPPNETLKEKY